VYLAVARPSTCLERAVVELCRTSLGLALKVRLHIVSLWGRRIAMGQKRSEEMPLGK
jgi:hypothetical protein